jgi:hypothetical protein
VKLTSTPGLVLPSNLKIIQFNLYWNKTLKKWIFK